MIRVQLKSLLKRLNRQITQALEAAAGLCVSRSHYEVTIEHLLLTNRLWRMARWIVAGRSPPAGTR